MNRNDAYAVLAAELESWKQLGYTALVKRVGQSSTVTNKSVAAGQEEISIRVQV